MAVPAAQQRAGSHDPPGPQREYLHVLADEDRASSASQDSMGYMDLSQKRDGMISQIKVSTLSAESRG